MACRPTNAAPLKAIRHLVAGVFLLVATAAAQPLPPADGPLDWRETDRDARREMESGLRALRIGLPGIALDILEPLSLPSSGLDAAERERAFLGTVDALIQSGRPGDAAVLLRSEGDPGDPPHRLRRAIAEYLLGNIDRSRGWLRGAEPENLPGYDVPWYHLLRALLADRAGDSVGFAEAFQVARDSTDSPFLRDTFDGVRARLDILRGEVDEETVIALKRQLEGAVAVPLRIQLAREYAVMLMGLGRGEEAVAFLEAFIEETDAAESVLADEILLPLAVFRGLSTPDGRSTLWDILRYGSDPDSLRVALGLLLAGLDGKTAAAADDVADIIEARPDHPIRDRLLFAQVELLSRSSEYKTALERLDGLLEEYPGTVIGRSARLSRAFLAWKQDPPQFRTAATRLLEIAPEFSPGERSRFYHLAGDLFFENGDFNSAASAYLQAWNEEPAVEVAFQYVNALLRDERIEEALQWNRELHAADQELSSGFRRRIDWNVARALVGQDRPVEALDLVDAVLEEESVPLAVEGNFRWLRAYLLSLLDRNAEALEVIHALVADLTPGEAPGGVGPPEAGGDANGPGSAPAAEGADGPGTETAQTPPEEPATGASSSQPDIDPAARKSILAQTLLLEGEIRFKSGREEEGIRVMNRLREEFGDRRAAVLSYLFEARYFAGRDLSGEAQLRLVNLADRFPESDYAPMALFEAAVIAESRGTPESISEAIRFLEAIVERFPDHALAFHARIKEGEILRSMGDFKSARLVFENTGNLFSSHPLRYLAELGAAETVLANPDAPAEELFEAVALLEKVPSIPGVPDALVVESRLKSAEALRRAGEKEAARRLLWESVDPFLAERDPGDASLGFWLSKSLLELSVWNDADGRSAEASRLLELIDSLDLPGERVARAKLRVRSTPDQ